LATYDVRRVHAILAYTSEEVTPAPTAHLQQPSEQRDGKGQPAPEHVYRVEVRLDNRSATVPLVTRPPQLLSTSRRLALLLPGCAPPTKREQGLAKNKREAKHRAAQLMLQQLRPEARSWGELLDLEEADAAAVPLSLRSLTPASQPHPP
jgi:hypothetical protein